MKYLKSDVERLMYAAPEVELTAVNQDEIGRWSQQRIAAFIAKILTEANNVAKTCGNPANTMICGPIIGTIVQTGCPWFNGCDEEGQIGMLNGLIKVYLVDEKDIDPEIAIIGYVTDTNSTTRVLRYRGISNCVRTINPFEEMK